MKNNTCGNCGHSLTEAERSEMYDHNGKLWSKLINENVGFIQREAINSFCGYVFRKYRLDLESVRVGFMGTLRESDAADRLDRHEKIVNEAVKVYKKCSYVHQPDDGYPKWYFDELLTAVRELYRRRVSDED